MRIPALILLASVAGGCTSVKMVQRDGCWVKRTEKIFGRVIEDLGPCRRAEPQWAEDRLTRLVQECVAQADYRWSVRANEAWAKGAPYPAQPPQQELLRTCMEEARVGLVSETEALKARLSEVTGNRDSLRVAAEQDHAKLRESHEKIAEWLGQAAQKPAGTATATATSTSDGKASNETGATLAAERGTPAPARASGVPGVRRGPRGADRRGPGRPDPRSVRRTRERPRGGAGEPPVPRAARHREAGEVLAAPGEDAARADAGRAGGAELRSAHAGRGALRLRRGRERCAEVAGPGSRTPAWLEATSASGVGGGAAGAAPVRSEAQRELQRIRGHPGVLDLSGDPEERQRRDLHASEEAGLPESSPP